MVRKGCPTVVSPSSGLPHRQFRPLISQIRWDETDDNGHFRLVNNYATGNAWGNSETHVELLTIEITLKIEM